MDQEEPTKQQKLRRLAAKVDALKRSMDVTIGLQTEDFGKWNGFANNARIYDRLARQYIDLTGDTDPSLYDVANLPNWADLLWHQAKNLFEQTYADVSLLSASLSEFEDAGIISRSEVHDLIETNLRRIVFEEPKREVEVQNAVESLFVGRGYQKGADYDRETGRVKYSGKEFVPDFVFKGYGLAIEVKLVRDRSKLANCVEEMSADIAAYLSAYESILFVVYDMGGIQDVSEFQLSFHNHAGVRVCVVKH